MEFHISKKHLQRENRKVFYSILFFSVISAGLIVKLLNTSKTSDLFFPVIGLFVFISLIFSSYKRIKEEKDTYPVLILDEPSGKLSVQYKDITVTVDLSQIKNLRLQHKSGQLISILIKTSADENLRFEGYENLDVLASALEQITLKKISQKHHPIIANTHSSRAY
jgi:hypothetical protein